MLTMKNMLVTIIIILLIDSIVHAKPINPPYIGLIDQLVEIKYNAEWRMSLVLNDTTSKDYQQKDKLNVYNELRILVDGILYQMSADMQERNSTKVFRRLNKHYKSHNLSQSMGAKKTFNEYTFALKKVYEKYIELVSGVKNNSEVAEIAEAFVPGAELGWTIYKDTYGMRKEKVEGILVILGSLRLASHLELTKKGEEPKK